MVSQSLVTLSFAESKCSGSINRSPHCTEHRWRVASRHIYTHTVTISDDVQCSVHFITQIIYISSWADDNYHNHAICIPVPSPIFIPWSNILLASRIPLLRLQEIMHLLLASRLVLNTVKYDVHKYWRPHTKNLSLDSEKHKLLFSWTGQTQNPPSKYSVPSLSTIPTKII